MTLLYKSNMTNTTNTPQVHVRIADGYEERAHTGIFDPSVILTIGNREVTLTQNEATSLADELRGFKLAFLSYSMTVKEQNQSKSAHASRNSS